MAEKKFTVECTEVIHEGYMVRTEMLTVRTPDGDLVQRQAIRHPGAVGVVAIHDGHVVLVEQYRAPLDDTLIEIPAGKTDVPGEPLDVAARRELIEEVGLDPKTLILLGDFVTAAGFCDEVLTLFATNDCIDVGRQVDGAEEAHSEILRIPLSEIGARDRGLLTPSA